MTIKPIPSLDPSLEPAIWQAINTKTKPLGSLGRLEQLACQLCLIQNTLSPVLSNPHILVFAADHGVANYGVSAYPQEVSWQMVQNFLNGGAAINVFCKQNGLKLKVIDAGVNHDFAPDTALIHAKIGYGTAPFHLGAAMSEQQLAAAMEVGRGQVDLLHHQGTNVIGFGEMGIGNTSSAAALMALITGREVELCIGRGTGIDDAAFLRKKAIIEQALVLHKAAAESGLAALAAVGGFEIAMMCGAILEAAHRQMVILADGFIVGAALLAASEICPAVLDYVVLSHLSEEAGHEYMIGYLGGGRPLLRLNMRLGEGTGAALAYPLVAAAAAFMREMASFEGAGVSQKNEG